jgi:hypothetical protein
MKPLPYTGTFYAPYIPLQVVRHIIIGAKFYRIGKHFISDKWVYEVNDHEVKKWIESQCERLWQYDSSYTHDSTAVTGSFYTFNTEEIEAWFLLRWS